MKLTEAIIFATKAHEGVTRKGKSTPYIMHPLEAAIIVAEMTDDEDLIVAAVLHDTVEDCPSVTIEQIREKFGERVAELVFSESEDKTKSWKERKSHTINHLMYQATKIEKMVILGDKLSNIRDIYRDYLKEGDLVWSRFNMKDKNEIGWYYKSIANAMYDLIGLRPYGEYCNLVEYIFG